MSAEFTANALRRLADSLDALVLMANETSVTVSAYTGSYLQLNGHQIRITWNADESTYTAEWPDPE